MKQRLVVIMGPTGAGKTEVSLHLAEMFNGEIISRPGHRYSESKTR